MKQLVIFALATCFSLSSVFAQLPNGSLAPDFTLTDLNGTSHNLYSYLDSGYTVIIDFSAVWCGPCWSYHTSGTLEHLYENHGPAGYPNVNPNTTDDVMVFMIEGDGNSADCLNGINCSNTLGDWVTGTLYPIICTDGTANNTAVTTAYAIGYWPTVYKVCPDRTISEIGQTSNPYSTVSSCPPPATNLNDVKAMNYAGVTQTCLGDLTPEVQVQNYGLTTLTSFDIEVLVDGVQNSIMPWAGNLPTYNLTTITLPTITGITASANVEIKISNPNGGTDDDMTNNDINFTATLTYQNSHTDVVVAITTDRYAAETSWNIKSSSGATIHAVPANTWSNLSANGQTIQTPVNVSLSANECYTFTIKDSYGDGICCSYGNGSYTITDGNGYVLASGGQFVDEESESFRTASVSGLNDNGIVNAISIYPNPANDMATLAFSTNEKSSAAISITNILGEAVYKNEIGFLTAGQHIMPISTAKLAEGMYFVNLMTNNKIITKKITIVK